MLRTQASSLEKFNCFKCIFHALYISLYLAILFVMVKVCKSYLAISLSILILIQTSLDSYFSMNSLKRITYLSFTGSYRTITSCMAWFSTWVRAICTFYWTRLCTFILFIQASTLKDNFINCLNIAYHFLSIPHLFPQNYLDR